MPTQQRKAKRWYCTLRRVEGPLDAAGQPAEPPSVLLADAPCELTPLFGRPLELARQRFALATLRARLYVSRETSLFPRPGDQLVAPGWDGNGERIFWVGDVTASETSAEVELLLSEARP